MGLCHTNCTLWVEDSDDSLVPADPDIAGIGIVIAFIATSFVTIAVAYGGLFLHIIPWPGNNAIDTWVSTKLQRVPWLQLSEERRNIWQPIIESLVMALSDQQLLVGISILIAGFASHCSISVYHFTIVIDLAWFSSNTNLTTLVVLEVYLAQRPSIQIWRVCLMLVILTGIIVATVLQGHNRWYTSYNSPAHCLFTDLPVKLCFDVAWFAYGLWDIVTTRKDGAECIEGNENAWGFGQITAILLLSSIILTLRESHAEQTAKLSNGNANEPSKANGNNEHEPQNIQTMPSNQELGSEEPEPAVLSPTRVDTEAGGRG
ncbi:MAG: hypothetical protein Q9211_001955 [Gyalolechia sp. 1 TL-2023]